ncbi:Ser/Thr protein phosphatase, putative [Trichomonas vaginalis G3]|uniref:protein-serine/threonine phosphatase n=1 Tax=Trichomonas vaginalis (strain ATCC PRA-98 / G3) TaxID=412133 RepID=A2G313_TRIV3|nr:phosphoprotein phosphatase protein [Trichomonas vaginalis G3]EAX88446.1 Ser/Thr protein phosphatase, putative [Trichomonas vaginalis G3]KAI5507072.1 phosphoprotein phosphatase protein [Trichomonas vaginalis G3]|eukprot:XP_001301376.1 Ser/Thr protein phosphatase [Trichomonas vaginalis G3]
MPIPPIISNIVRTHLVNMRHEFTPIPNTNSTVNMPFFEEADLNELLENATNIIQSELVILNLFAPVILIGALQGDIFQLYGILSRFGLPPTRTYCFLGNMIDDGDFSLETITFILALKVVYPRNIYIIRGKNEFEQVAKGRTFFNEIQEYYPQSTNLFDRFMTAFSYLPIAAIFFQNIFCIHGGLFPEFTQVQQLLSVQRPLTTIDSSNLGIFFSEPSTHIKDYYQRNSRYVFGEAAFEKFMKLNELTLFVRTSSPLNAGYMYQFEEKLLTLTKSAVLAVFGSNDYKAIKLPINSKFTRADVQIVPYSKIANENKQLQISQMPKVASIATTNRKTSMRILDSSRDAIPSGHPILTIYNGTDKLSQISRIRTYVTSRPVTRIETFY